MFALLILKNPHQKSGVVACAYSLGAGEAKTGRFLGLVSSRPMWTVLEERQLRSASDLRMYVHILCSKDSVWNGTGNSEHCSLPVVLSPTTRTLS